MQTGLLTGYTSLSTDFALYLAVESAAPTRFRHRLEFEEGLPTRPRRFNLGGTYVLESMAFWNFGASEPLNLVGFELHASNDASFATSTPLGAFEANPLLTTDAGTAQRYFRSRLLRRHSSGPR